MYNEYGIMQSGYPSYGETRDRCIKAFDYNGLLELTRQNSIADIVNARSASNSLMHDSVSRMKSFQRNRQIGMQQAKLLNSIIPFQPRIGI